MDLAELLAHAAAVAGRPDCIQALGEKLVYPASISWKGKDKPSEGIAEFTATLSTCKEDRDGDILVSSGANVDPAMPLLWAHDRKLPLGKLLNVVEKTSERLRCRYVIADTPLGRDAVALAELGALRMSHGFQPTKYRPRAGKAGFFIEEFNVFESSLVSIPANPDAQIEVFSRVKSFQSPEMNSLRAAVMAARPRSSSVRSGFSPQKGTGAGMILNSLLRAYVWKTFGLEDDATDDAVRAVIAEKIATGDLTPKMILALTPGEKGPLNLSDTEKQRLKAWAESMSPADLEHVDPEWVKSQRAALQQSGGFTWIRSPRSGDTDNPGNRMLHAAHMATLRDEGRLAGDPADRYAYVGRGGTGYSTEKTKAFHAKTGQPVMLNGKQLSMPSDMESYLCGVWLRSLAVRTPGLGGTVRALNSTEKDALEVLYTRHGWMGDARGEYYSRSEPALGGETVKSLIDDSVSGGQFLTPDVVDDLLVLAPLLGGEISPFITWRELSRGNAVQTGRVNPPTVVWGTAEGTAQALFSTAGLIADVNASVQPVAAFIELGRDLLSDASPILGELLREGLQQRMASELDRVIADGNGTTEPQGIMQASGVTTVASVNGTNGPLTVADIENMYFSCPKQYRRANLMPSFVLSDSTYAAARGIAVGPNDERRVFGMSHEDYKLLNAPARITTALADTEGIFGSLKNYRMWRRAGAEIRLETGGMTLARSNTALLILRGRYAGRVADPSGFAVCTTLPS